MTHVEISVVDIATRDEIEGAHVQVLAPGNNVVEEWDSGTENYVIEGLKTNVEYTLSETAAPNRYAAPADYTFEIAPDGSITFTGSTEDGVLLVENTKTGDLIVSNTLVSDLASDANQEFGFTVTLGDQSINGTYGDMTFESGVATFTLKDGQEKTAANLLYGTTYTVTQVEAEGFTIEKTGDEGTIGQESWTAAFTNTRETGKLIVTNTVYSDSESDANQVFEFTVTLGDQSINGTYGDMTFESGVATFTLKDGQEKTATGLPTTMTYMVTGPGVSGFQLSGSTGVEGTIGNEASTATFKYIKLIDVSVAIMWNDNNNQDGKRPSEVSVILKANDEQVGSKVLNNGNEWRYTFENQPSCTQEGSPIVYSWEMPATATPEGYTLSETTVDHNTTLTLTHEPAKTQVTVQAIWDDDNNTNGLRPDNVNVKLLFANGVEVWGSEATLNADNGWSHTWEVVKYANGQEIEYTVSQEKLNNYNAPVITNGSASGWDFTVTNTISGVILKNDGNSITLTLTNPAAPQEVSIPTVVEVDHVKVDRIYVNGKASTVYLPFSIAADKVSGGTFYSFTGVDEAKTPWEVTYDEVKGTIEANTPYIFLPDGTNGGKIVVDNGSDKVSVSTANPQTMRKGQWEFIGTYKCIKWTSDPDATGYTAERATEIGSVYGFAAKDKTVNGTAYSVGQFVKIGSGAFVNPLRAYLKRTSTSGARTRGAVESLPSNMKVILVNANGSTTEIGTFSLDAETGDWYSLDGRKLSAKPTKKGLYINNGKKVVIR